jgi:hypothetical protein
LRTFVALKFPFDAQSEAESLDWQEQVMSPQR